MGGGGEERTMRAALDEEEEEINARKKKHLLILCSGLNSFPVGVKNILIKSCGNARILPDSSLMRRKDEEESGRATQRRISGATSSRKQLF